MKKTVFRRVDFDYDGFRFELTSDGLCVVHVDSVMRVTDPGKFARTIVDALELLNDPKS